MRFDSIARMRGASAPAGARAAVHRLSRSGAAVFRVLLVSLMLTACGSGPAGDPSVGAGAGVAQPQARRAQPAPSTAPKVYLLNVLVMRRLRELLAAQVPTAVRFKAMVDGQLAGADYWSFQPWFAALMGQLTQGAQYCRYAVDRMEASVASEEALIASGAKASVSFDSYLYVGEQIGNVALVYDWCRESMTDSQRARWLAYANQTVWNVWHHEQAQWGGKSFPWSGWSVDNPSNNYYYSFLRATMLLGLATRGENPQAQAWLDIFRNKINNELVPTFQRDLVGGGSREGTGYGAAMGSLFLLYDWWEKSTGESLASRTPHALASIAQMIHSIVPTLDRLAPTGDHARDSSAALYDTHRHYLQVLMRLYPGETVSRVAKTLLEQSSVPRMGAGYMFYSDFLYDYTDIAALPLSVLSPAYWSSGTGQFSMRSSWSKDAGYANLICGPYTENHAHRDQGSFVLFKGGWLAFDANVVSKSGIETPEANHNLVRIEQGGNVVTQVQGTTCAMDALADTADYAYAVARVTPVYGGKAAVVKAEREFLFLKPATWVVLDRVQTSGSGVKRIWTLNLPAAPMVEGDRLSLVSGANRLDAIRLSPSGLQAQVVAWPAANSDYVGGARVDVADSGSDSSLFLHVLGMDGSVVSAVRDDAIGQMGARITLADGRTAVARFNVAGHGGAIELTLPAGGIAVSGALPASVLTWPLLQGQ